MVTRKFINVRKMLHAHHSYRLTWLAPRDTGAAGQIPALPSISGALFFFSFSVNISTDHLPPILWAT